MEERETIFADGMIFKRPHENAPDFVKGAISIKVDEFKEFLDKHANNGWVNLDLKKSKNDKLYLQLNDYKSRKPLEKPDFIKKRDGESNIDPLEEYNQVAQDIF